MDISYFLNQREGVKYEEIGKKPLAGSFQRRVSALTTHEEPLGAFKPLSPRQIPDPGNQKVGLGGEGSVLIPSCSGGPRLMAGRPVSCLLELCGCLDRT